MADVTAPAGAVPSVGAEPAGGVEGQNRDLVVGVGARKGVAADEVLDLVLGCLRDAGLPQSAVRGLATVDAKRDEPGVAGAAARLGVPLAAYSAEELARVAVAGRSGAVLAAVGTPSVAEAAALARGGELLVPKRRSTRATCAVARVPARPRAAAEVRSADATGAGQAPKEPAGGVRPGRESQQYRGTVGDMNTDMSTDVGTGLGTDLGTDTDSDSVSRVGTVGGGGVTDVRAEDVAVCPVGSAEDVDLRHHGDAEVRDSAGPGRPGGPGGPGGAAGLIGLAGPVDLAVNVRSGTPPAWLKQRIAASLDGLAAYPDGRAARAAVAARHGVEPGRVLLTAGAAEAFVLLARALRVRRPVVVHPQFTEPEAALRDAGHTVRRVLLRAADGFRLDPAAVPEDADLVVVGNPTNPTSVLHPAADLARLARPGRVLVVDEAFMDAVPGEREALAGRVDVPGLVVLRSLTKTWGLAGLRIGYVLADPATIGALERAQPLWPVSSPALAAAEACVTPRALAEAGHVAHRVAADRRHLVAGLSALPGVEVVGPAEGPFVLVRTPGAATVVRERLLERGFVVRRGDTFPGLGPDWVRVAVRGRATTEALVRAWPGGCAA
ncbi:Rv2231c family pyridoxal phosphate-dependent protein CobC [Streptomyces sp. CC224B]|uniref:Rv2231c family pyridoxal phosphate-dependent protein CobC n=1 Tax=Streptomyces sp. CC224B TaxID=3044571 RepID=UPI0024A90777|nr:Rv2231c family pyridoxal phosphate-dependent protein CobC [Streptomyces sp. CC224B]